MVNYLYHYTREGIDGAIEVNLKEKRIPSAIIFEGRMLILPLEIEHLHLDFLALNFAYINVTGN